MKLHSYYQITCDCGTRHEIEETYLVCECNRVLVIQWGRAEVVEIPTESNVTDIQTRKAVA